MRAKAPQLEPKDPLNYFRSKQQSESDDEGDDIF
jgi:hypothetical protein